MRVWLRPIFGRRLCGRVCSALLISGYNIKARAGVHACACGSDLFSVVACVAAFALRCYCRGVKMINKRRVSRCACGYCSGGRGSARGWAWHPLAPNKIHSAACDYCSGGRGSARGWAWHPLAPTALQQQYSTSAGRACVALHGYYSGGRGRARGWVWHPLAPAALILDALHS